MISLFGPLIDTGKAFKLDPEPAAFTEKLSSTFPPVTATITPCSYAAVAKVNLYDVAPGAQ
jgi:hypothetical protein